MPTVFHDLQYFVILCAAIVIRKHSFRNCHKVIFICSLFNNAVILERMSLFGGGGQGFDIMSLSWYS